MQQFVNWEVADIWLVVWATKVPAIFQGCWPERVTANATTGGTTYLVGIWILSVGIISIHHVLSSPLTYADAIMKVSCVGHSFIHEGLSTVHLMGLFGCILLSKGGHLRWSNVQCGGYTLLCHISEFFQRKLLHQSYLILLVDDQRQCLSMRCINGRWQ